SRRSSYATLGAATPNTSRIRKIATINPSSRNPCSPYRACRSSAFLRADPQPQAPDRCNRFKSVLSMLPSHLTEELMAASAYYCPSYLPPQSSSPKSPPPYTVSAQCLPAKPETHLPHAAETPGALHSVK